MYRIKQKDSTDCAVASLMSILKYYKGNISYELLRNYMKCDKNGVSAYDLVLAAKKIGFDAVGVKCSYEDIQKIKLPCIAHVTLKDGYNHYVVIESLSNKINVYDPFLGNKKYTKEEFENIWNNIIIMMNPVNVVRENNKKNNYIYLIFKYKKNIIILIVMTLLSILLSLLGTYYFKILIDYSNITKKIFIVFSTMLSIRLVIDYFKNKIVINIDNRVEKDLMFSSIYNLLSLQENYFANKQKGDILSRINSIENIKSLLFKIPFISTMYLCIIIFCLSILIIINIKIFSYSIILLFIYIIIHLIFHKKNKNYIKNINEEKGFSNGYTSELLDGLSSIRQFDFKNKMHNRFTDYYSKYLSIKYKYENLYNREDILKNSILLISLNYILYIGTSFLSVGNLVLFYIIISMVIDSIKGILELEQELNNGLIAINRFEELLSTDEHGYYSNKIDKVQFNNVTFSYKNGNNILNNINFEILKNDKVLIKGISGSGKTTIFNLLIRKYNVDTGNIIIGNENINNWSSKGIRNHITYISINEKIFKGTIEENICFGEVDNIKLNKIMKECLFDFDQSFQLEEDGNNISLGEKSKLLMCRALYKKSKLLIIDELLSNIGLEEENIILSNIVYQYKDMIIMYSSHRDVDLSLFNKKIILKEKEGILCII